MLPDAVKEYSPPGIKARVYKHTLISNETAAMYPAAAGLVT